MVDLAKLEYTQPGISFSTRDRDTGEERSVGRMAAEMKKTGWDVSKPADVVKMSDGRLVSLDHRRLWAADRARASNGLGPCPQRVGQLQRRYREALRDLEGTGAVRHEPGDERELAGG